MALSNISFVLGQGGLGRPLPGQDYISGLIFYSNTLPSGFTSQNNIKLFTSVQDAVNAGINSTYPDETQASATVTVTQAGTNGDTITINVQEPVNKVALATYTKVSTDTTTALVAASIAAAINANTLITGYTATVNSNVVTIKARPGLGIFLNTNSPLSQVTTGGITAPGIPSLTPSTSGGTLAAATYFYKITALNAAGETVGSPEASCTTTGSTSSVQINWAAVTGATSYKIYRGTTAGNENVFYTSATNSFLDTNGSSTGGTVPTSNTTIITSTLVQFSGGAASLQAVWNYHISEFFRMQPQGNLYVGFFPVPGGTYSFAEIATLQNFSGGKIRQVGIYKDGQAYSSGDLAAIHNQCATLVAAHKEIQALYGADLSGTADISTIADLSGGTSNYVSSVISQDGGALGATLYFAYGKSITTLGAALGAVAFAKVNESIAWVGKFNISNGTECDVPAFANGVLYSSNTFPVTDNLLSLLQNRRHIFFRKFVGIAGTYFNDNPTATAPTSSYAYISDNRTIQKCTRGVYSNLLQSLNSPIQLNSDGTLTDSSIAYFKGLAEAPLIQMIRNGEISAQGVVVSATQNVLSTSTLVISISIVPFGTARQITVNIGFNVKIV